MARDISRKKIKASILIKGFLKSRKASDHDMYYFVYKGKTYKHIVVKLSRGSSYKTYDISLISKMKTRVRLDTNQQIYDLFECPMDFNKYIEILKEKSELD